MRTYRLIFLGAGFSQPAGLPLGHELFPAARRLLLDEWGPTSHFERDLKRYLAYVHAMSGRELDIDDVDFEEFLGFLDVEHFLNLKGSDTWSEEGNESQLLMRYAIGRVLLARTPPAIPEVYRRFVRQLSPDDWIFTFNYDTLLERALDAEGVPYRLFPHRYSEVGPAGATVDQSREEVVVLKMHGSVDWVSREPYDANKAYGNKLPIPWEPKHPVFGPHAVASATPLVDGPRFDHDALSEVYRVRDADMLYRSPLLECTPLILAPSQAKLLYARPLVDFWTGLSQSGGLSLGLCIVGYSLPQYDSYARQALYAVCQNYTGVERNLTLEGRTKRKIRLVTLADTRSAVRGFKRRYSFIDWSHAELWRMGVSADAFDWLLR